MASVGKSKKSSNTKEDSVDVDQLVSDLNMEEFKNVLEQVVNHNLPDSEKCALVRQLNQQVADEESSLESLQPASSRSNGKPVNGNVTPAPTSPTKGSSDGSSVILVETKISPINKESNSLANLESFCESYLHRNCTKSIDLPDSVNTDKETIEIEMRDLGTRSRIVEFSTQAAFANASDVDLAIDFSYALFGGERKERNTKEVLNETELANVMIGNTVYSNGGEPRKVDNLFGSNLTASTASAARRAKAKVENLFNPIGMNTTLIEEQDNKQSGYSLNSTYGKKALSGSQNGNCRTEGLGKKRKKVEKAKLAEEIEGYVGDRDLEYLTNYVTGNMDNPPKEPSKESRRKEKRNKQAKEAANEQNTANSAGSSKSSNSGSPTSGSSKDICSSASDKGKTGEGNSKKQTKKKNRAERIALANGTALPIESISISTQNKKTLENGENAAGKTPEIKNLESKISMSKSLEGKYPEGKSPQGKNSQSKNSQGKSPQGKSSHSKSPQGKNSESKNLEGKSTENKSLESNGLQGKNLENKIHDIRTLEIKTSESKTLTLKKNEETKKMNSSLPNVTAVAVAVTTELTSLESMPLDPELVATTSAADTLAIHPNSTRQAAFIPSSPDSSSEPVSEMAEDLLELLQIVSDTEAGRNDEGDFQVVKTQRKKKSASAKQQAKAADARGKHCKHVSNEPAKTVTARGYESELDYCADELRKRAHRITHSRMTRFAFDCHSDEESTFAPNKPSAPSTSSNACSTANANRVSYAAMARKKNAPIHGMLNCSSIKSDEKRFKVDTKDKTSSYIENRKNSTSSTNTSHSEGKVSSPYSTKELSSFNEKALPVDNVNTSLEEKKTPERTKSPNEQVPAVIMFGDDQPTTISCRMPVNVATSGSPTNAGGFTFGFFDADTPADAESLPAVMLAGTTAEQLEAEAVPSGRNSRQDNHEEQPQITTDDNAATSAVKQMLFGGPAFGQSNNEVEERVNGRAANHYSNNESPQQRKFKKPLCYSDVDKDSFNYAHIVSYLRQTWDEVYRNFNKASIMNEKMLRGGEGQRIIQPVYYQ